MTNSRAKGSRNERVVSKLMADWSGYEFARTPQSGGLHWKKSQTSGDIVCIDDKHGRRFAFSIECKFHEDLDILHLLQGLIGKKSNKIIDFWEQSSRDALSVNKLPIVFMRRNGMKAGMHFVMIHTPFFLTWLNAIMPWETEHGVIHFTNKEYNLTIINSEDLVKTDYNLFHQTARRILKNVTTKI